MFNGRTGYLQDTVIADKQKELQKKAELIRMVDEAHHSATGIDHPSHIAAVAGWVGGKLIRAGNSLQGYSNRQNDQQ